MHLGCYCHSLSVSVCKRRTRSREGRPSARGRARSTPASLALGRWSSACGAILSETPLRDAPLLSNWGSGRTETLGVIYLDALVEPVLLQAMLVQKFASQAVYTLLMNNTS